MRKKRGSKKLMLASPLPMQRQFAFAPEGHFFDLQLVFDRLNREYFRSSLRGYRIEWGRRTAHRAKRTFVFAYIRESEKLIRVNPWLDQAWVPEWFLRYVVFHEMLHAVVPDDFTPSGRRRVHHPEFVRREREFPHYRKARRWLDANLARLLA